MKAYPLNPSPFCRPTWRILAALLLWALLLSACRGEPRNLVRPTGVAAVHNGSLFIIDHVDRNHSRVIHIDTDGKSLAAFQLKNQKRNLVYSGWDIAVGPDGDVYYCNIVRDEERKIHDGILAFSPEGKFLFEFGAYDYPLDSSQMPHSPYNLDVDEGGRIYVADYNYNEVRVFDPRGNLLTVFTKDTVDHFNYDGIGDVVVDDRRGELYVTDYANGRLDQYQRIIQPDGTPQLNYQWSMGTFGHGPGQFSFPQYLAVDQVSGIVYVGDMGNRRIVAVDPDGKYITDFSPPEVEDWQVLGLTVGDDPDTPGARIVYAADAFNDVIWAFKPNGQFLREIEVH